MKKDSKHWGKNKLFYSFVLLALCILIVFATTADFIKTDSGIVPKWYESQEACEHATKKQCYYDMCDNAIPGMNTEQPCVRYGQGKGWIPVSPNSSDVKNDSQ